MPSGAAWVLDTASHRSSAGAGTTEGILIGVCVRTVGLESAY